MAFLYKRQNRSTMILIPCPGSHLLLQLSDTSAALAGERKNLGVRSWQVNKGENVFSIRSFKRNMLQIWGSRSCEMRERCWFIFPGDLSMEAYPLASLGRSGEVPRAGSSQAPEGDSEWFLPGSLLQQDGFQKWPPFISWYKYIISTWSFKDGWKSYHSAIAPHLIASQETQLRAARDAQKIIES